VRVACVYPPKPYLTDPGAQAGLGLLCLATLAREVGAEVDVLDWQSLPDVPPEPPGCDVALVSGCMADIPMVDKAARLAKRGGAYVAVGGPIADDPSLKLRFADAVIAGPGEPFIERLAAGELPAGRLVYEDDQPFDRWPAPDRRLLPNPGGRIFHPRAGVAAQQSATLITTRGCRYRCAFCREGGRGGHHDYPMDRVAEEVKQIAAMGIRQVRVGDDNCTASLARLEALCGIMAEHRLKWRASCRTRPGGADVFRLMAGSGCLEVNLGIESADQAVLEALHKSATVECGEQAVENATAAGIRSVRALFMMGTPGETPRTLDLNKQWADRHRDVLVCLTAFVPFPGTAIWADPGRFGVQLDVQRPNISFYSFRPDGSEPEAHIEIVGGMGREELTANLREFRRFLDARRQINRG